METSDADPGRLCHHSHRMSPPEPIRASWSKTHCLERLRALVVAIAGGRLAARDVGVIRGIVVGGSHCGGCLTLAFEVEVVVKTETSPQVILANEVGAQKVRGVDATANSEVEAMGRYG